MDLVYLEANNLATLLIFSWHERIRGTYGFTPNSNPYKEYIFGLKPQSLNVNKPKIFGKKIDLGGIIIEHWINDIQSFDFKCTTGSLVPIYPEMNNLKSSAVYQWFLQLDLFIQKHNQDILMSYEDIKYWGFFSNFNYAEDADNPFVIDYSFTFNVYPYDRGFREIDVTTPTTGDAINVIEYSFADKVQEMTNGNDYNREDLDRSRFIDPLTPNITQYRGALSLSSFYLWDTSDKLGAYRFKTNNNQGAIRTDKK